MANAKDKGISSEFTKGEHQSPQWIYRFIDATKIEAGEHIVPAALAENAGHEFAELHMISDDFSFALDCFREADKIGLPDSENLLSKSLIFSAVVAYARPFKTGVRQLRIGAQYFSSLPTFSIETHEYLIAVRDKHVAHSVNEFEHANATGVMVGTPQTNWRPAGVGVTIIKTIGLSKTLVEHAIAHTDGLLDFINRRIDQIAPGLFEEFRTKFARDGKWEMAPIARLPDRKNAARRRS